ncbi:unnamed protein product [Prunus armeniaca]|uniref:Uncharacterized protein n=1 Tax=Prunus armeniaca TaxID=36596 RepID=A0A6J5XCE4_PRUAR|nr:unnamed protein product [Prunus armeniaca]
MWGRSRDDVAHSRAVSRTVFPGPYTPDVALGEVGHVSPSIVAALDSKHNKFAHSHDLSFQSKGAFIWLWLMGLGPPAPFWYPMLAIA